MMISVSTRRRLFSALPILLLAMASASGQGGRSEDNVLFPHPIPIPRMLIGPDAGWGYWMNMGRFGVTDRNLPCATFTDGNGHGPTVGARAIVHLTHSLFVSPRLRYELRPGNFATPLAGEPIRNQANEVVTMEQEAEAKGGFGVVSFDAMAGLHPFGGGLYVTGGGSAGLILSASFDYTERILAPVGVVYDDTRKTTHTPGPDREFENAASFSLALRGGIGYLHRMGRFTLNPEFFYSRSLTPLLNDPDSMDQQGFVAVIGLLWEL